MKKLITLSLCLLFVTAGYAQSEDSPKKIHLGLVGSGGIGWVATESKNLEGGGAKAGLGSTSEWTHFAFEDRDFYRDIVRRLIGPCEASSHERRR